MKIFLFMSFFLASLVARENPFFPASGEQEIPISSNEQLVTQPLHRATITLPSTARKVESVTIKYKNLDGSIREITQELDNTIDWHIPIFVSQSYQVMKKQKKTLRKPSKYKKLAGLRFISLYEKKRVLKLVTKDKLIRNFLLTKPHRIVCDFKRNINIRAYKKNIKNIKSVVTKLRIGNHKGYYRLVIELDGFYRYKLKSTTNGYVFNLL